MGNDLPSLYKQIETTNNAIVNFLKENGISDKEYTVNAPQVNDLQADRYGNQNVPYRYVVTTVVVVTSSQVEKITGLMRQQTKLMQQGIAIVAGDYNYQTLYEFTELNKVKPEMVAEATKNARQAANKFAEDSDSRLGKIKSANQGQFSIEDRDQYTPTSSAYASSLQSNIISRTDAASSPFNVDENKSKKQKQAGAHAPACFYIMILSISFCVA